MNSSIKAVALLRRDKDYVVVNGEILSVDGHTGRILMGRGYNEGIHQAIEAKEGVEVKAENQTLATVTLQNYFRLYDKLGGRTGTAATAAAEFMSTYQLGGLAIPTNKAMPRIDQQDLVAWLHGVDMDLDLVGAVFQRVGERDGLVGQLSLLADRHEAAGELVGDGSTQNEAPGLDPGHLMDLPARIGVHQRVDRPAERPRVAQ